MKNFSRRGIAPLVLILVVVGLLVVGGALYVANKQVVSSMPRQKYVGAETWRVHVKFKDDARVRLRDNQLISLKNVDLVEVQNVLSHYSRIAVERMSSWPEEELDVVLNSWYYFVLPKGDAGMIKQLVAELKDLSVIEDAYLEPMYSQ